MTENHVVAWIEKMGLQPSEDRKGRKVFRAVHFGPVNATALMEEVVQKALLDERRRKNLSVRELAHNTGLSEQIIRRCEKLATRLAVARFVQFCEGLDCCAVNLLYLAAPHLFGKTERSSVLRRDIMARISKLDTRSLGLLEELIQFSSSKASCELPDPA